MECSSSRLLCGVFLCPYSWYEKGETHARDSSACLPFSWHEKGETHARDSSAGLPFDDTSRVGSWDSRCTSQCTGCHRSSPLLGHEKGETQSYTTTTLQKRGEGDIGGLVREESLLLIIIRVGVGDHGRLVLDLPELANKTCLVVPSGEFACFALRQAIPLSSVHAITLGPCLLATRRRCGLR